MLNDGWWRGETRPVDLNGPVEAPFEPLVVEDAYRHVLPRIAQMVERYPSKVAIFDGVRELTYLETWRAAHNLAWKIDKAAPRGEPVVALLESTVLYPVALLAVTLTGRLLIAVDAGHPKERQRAIVEESGLGLLLHAPGLEIDQELVGPHVPRLLAEIDTGEGPAFPAPERDPAEIAAVGFTSGSTGRPKGIAYSLGSAMMGLAQFSNACHANADDKILSIASLSVGGSKDVFCALLNGGCVRICDIKTAGLNEALRIMDEERITILSFIPVVIRSVLQIPGAEKAFRHLRVLDLYSDRTLSSDIELFREKLPPTCHIRVSLASTEVGSMFDWWVPRHMRFEEPAIPVGYPAANKDFMLLDEDGRPAAPGEAGEIVVRSRTMAMGAWQAGKLLPGRFLTDPKDPSYRIYHVGDLVRLRDDGLAEYLGRRDRQVKIRGQKADPGDVEALLRHLDTVADVAVIARKLDGDAVFIAYVAPADPENPPTTSQVQTALRGEAPPHMIPAEVHVLDKIPRLANYKPDVLRLMAIDAAHTPPSAPAVSERSAVEEPLTGKADEAVSAAVAAAWTAILGQASLARNDAWHASGGDSLKALKLMFHIEEALDAELPLELLDWDTSPTVLAQRICAFRMGPDAEGAPSDAAQVFLFPGIAGDEPRLAAFRLALAAKARFVTLDYPDLDRPAAEIADWSQIVDRAVSEVERRQPDGPLRLAGYSFGGLVALEVAQRLRAAGRRIAFVGVLDTLVEHLGKAPLSGWDRHAARFRASASVSGPVVALGEAALRALVANGGGELGRRAVMAARTAMGSHRALYARKVLLESLRSRALGRCAPTRFEGEVWLFRAAEQPPWVRSADLGWRELCTDLKIVEVDGDHLSQFAPDRLKVNAPRFVEALDQVSPSA